MNTPLYKLAEENFGTIRNFYDLIRKKSEQYHSFITKFKSATKDYCNNMKNLFNSEIIEDNNDSNKEKDQSTRKRGSTNIIKVNVDLNENWMKTKNIDISPIETNIEKINKIFDNYFECLQLFVDSLETQSLTLNQGIDNAKQSFNRIKDNYLSSKNTFLQKYSEFEQLNKKMSSMYFDQEKNILEFLIKTKPPITREKENDLNLKIFDALATQKELKKSFINLGNFGKEFNDSYEISFNEIKNTTEEFYIIFEKVIKFIGDFYQKSFLSKIKEFENNMSAQMKGKDFKENLNQSLKNIDPKLSNISFDIYKINTIKCNTKEENHINDKDKTLINLIRNSNLKKIDDKEIFYVARKMNNFEYIDKKEYVLEIEKEKLKLRDKLFKLFYYANQNKVKKNNDKNNENKLNNNNENKDNAPEEDKLDNNEKKEEEPNQEDLNYICKLMKKKDYRDYLLTKLNNHRAEGSLAMPENVYNIFVKIFLEIMKYLVEEKEKDSVKELNIDYTATRFIFILSQTFYYKKDGAKIYIQNGIKNQKIFQLEEFWIKLLQYNIKQELIKLADKSQKKFDEKEKGKEICVMQILPYLNGFIGFGVNKETVEKVTNFFIKEYELNEESQKLIFEAIKISENQ